MIAYLFIYFFHILLLEVVAALGVGGLFYLAYEFIYGSFLVGYAGYLAVIDSDVFRHRLAVDKEFPLGC